MAAVSEPLRSRIHSLAERHGRRTLAILAVIVLVGFALRAERVVNPNAKPGDDALAYFALSKSLCEDGSYGGPDFQNSSDWSPGAPSGFPDASWPAKTVVSFSGLASFWSAMVTAGRALRAAQPQIEFTTTNVVPGASLSVPSTCSGVRSSSNPIRVSSWRMGATMRSS